MKRAMVVVMVLASAAWADRTPEQDKAFKAALAQGRGLEAKGKLAEAAAAYADCLKISPDDPTALAELGWVQFEQKSDAAAEATTRKAIAHAPEPQFPGDPMARVKAAALFNLGQILEREKQPPRALESYVASAKLRPTRTVRAAIAKLDAAAVAMIDPFAPVKLQGPFASPAAFCHAHSKRDGIDEDATEKAQCDDPTTYKFAGRGKAPVPPPIKEVVLFQPIDRTELDIGIRLDAGWYIDAVTTGRNRGTGHCGGTEFAWTGAKDASFGGNPRIRIEYTSTGSCDHKIRTWGWTDRGVALIGIGPSKLPSAAPPVLLSMREWSQTDEAAKTIDADVALSPVWGKDTVTITGKVRDDNAPDPNDAEVLLGTHALVFP